MERLLDPHDEELARKVARSTLVTRALILASIVLLGAVLVVSLVIASSTNETAQDTKTVVKAVRAKQNSNAPLLQSIQDLAKQINSCTDPAGACAKRGAKSTASAVLDISVRQIAAVACADQPGTQSVGEIKACVDRTVRVLAAAKPADR